MGGTCTFGGADVAGGSKKRIKPSSEHQIHVSVAKYLDTVLVPGRSFWSTFPSGGYMLNRVAAANLKKRGLKPGMPDIMIWSWVPTSGPLYSGKSRCIGIEIKRPKMYATPQQRHTHRKLLEVGVSTYICRSIEDVAKVLDREGIPTRESKNVSRETRTDSDGSAWDNLYGECPSGDSGALSARIRT